MSVSMIHESNAFALPAEDEDDMDSIFFIIGNESCFVHYDEGEHDCIEVHLLPPGSRYVLMSLQ